MRAIIVVAAITLGAIPPFVGVNSAQAWQTRYYTTPWIEQCIQSSTSAHPSISRESIQEYCLDLWKGLIAKNDGFHMICRFSANGSSLDCDKEK